ncbi:MAG: hypothetical protein AAGH64_10935, partial [Planctomycetota bacterium]
QLLIPVLLAADLVYAVSIGSWGLSPFASAATLLPPLCVIALRSWLSRNAYACTRWTTGWIMMGALACMFAHCSEPMYWPRDPLPVLVMLCACSIVFVIVSAYEQLRVAEYAGLPRARVASVRRVIATTLWIGSFPTWMLVAISSAYWYLPGPANTRNAVAVASVAMVLTTLVTCIAKPLDAARPGRLRASVGVLLVSAMLVPGVLILLSMRSVRALEQFAEAPYRLAIVVWFVAGVPLCVWLAVASWRLGRGLRPARVQQGDG